MVAASRSLTAAARVTAPVHARTGGDAALAGLCGYLEWLGWAGTTDWRRAAAAAAGQALEHLLVLPRPGDTATAAGLPTPVRHAVDHLRRAWTTPPLASVPVPELAAAATVSPGHLNRLFRAEFGLSVAAAVERLRCLRAATLLERTDLTAAQVARECGFADASHFSHRFRVLTGGPPSGHRAGTGRDGGGRLRDHPGLRRLEALVTS